MQCSGPSAPHILKTGVFRLHLFYMQSSGPSAIVKQPDVRFDLFLMQCLQSLAPFFPKQCGVKSVLFYTLCPLHSEMVECSRCWGVQISFIYMQCSGPLAPFFLKQWLFKLSSDIFEVLKSYLLFETFRSCAVGVYQFQMGHPAPPKNTTKKF